jgi:hypothetical protein
MEKKKNYRLSRADWSRFVEALMGVVWIVAGAAGWYFYGGHIQQDDIKDAVFLICVLLEVAGISKLMGAIKKGK